MDKLTGKSMARIQVHAPSTGSLRACQDRTRSETPHKIYFRSGAWYSEAQKRVCSQIMRVVFRDSCFDDTVVKTNTNCILKDNGADRIECV